VTVVVPATSANLGPGFDCLGVALDLTDEVTAEVTGEGVTVEVTGEGAGEVPTDERHLVVATMLTTFARLGLARPPGLRLICVNRIPHARGLGSSSAAIVAGILLAQALAEETAVDGKAATDGRATPAGGTGGRTAGVCPDARRQALAWAAELEGHPDNVAPCLLGGFVIAWTGVAGAEAVRLTPAPDVRPVLYVPDRHGFTAHARAALPEQVPHRDAAFNLARSALLVHALTQAPELLMAATEDRLHQPYRAAAEPETAALVASLRAAGIPAVVSGAGPSVLAFTGSFAPEPPDPPAGWVGRALAWSPTGARMLGRGHADSDPVAAGRVG
jgi:homoserine kinase